MPAKQAALITSRDPKGLQLTNLFEAALNKSALDDEAAQRIIERGGELKTKAMEILAELSFVETYASEEVRSSYAYPKGYTVTPIREQVELLAKAFPQLSVDVTLEYIETVLPTLQLPEGTEWFAIPRWEKIAPTYGEAVEKILAVLASSRPFYNYREGQLGPEHLRQHERSLRFWQQIRQLQGGDILIVAAQFGLKHRGRSARRARAVFQGNEFGLGAFAIGSMLFTNPGRLVAYEDLWIDCAGDEFSPDAGGQFGGAPCFCFGGGGLFFDSYWVDLASVFCGSASGVLPQ